LSEVNEFGCEYAQKAMQKIDNKFWKDVLKHYKKLYIKCQPQNIHEFLSECIHYNINITRGHKVIYVKEWVENGIRLIRHLLNEKGNFMLFAEFQRRYPTVEHTNYLSYEGIIRAIKQYQTKLSLISIDKYKILNTKVWFLIKKGNKCIYNQLASTNVIPTAIAKWKLKFENMEWRKAFNICYLSTKDVQIRWFQVRLLHRILPSEKRLHTLKIVESPNCNICKLDEIQTIQHLFWECNIVQLFWNEFIQTLKTKCSHCSQLNLNENIVLFGFETNIITDPVFDYLIILGKFYIYKCKLESANPNVPSFLKFVQGRYNIDSYIAAIQMDYHNFCRKWEMYRPLMVCNTT
jgi:hypothetical protein